VLCYVSGMRFFHCIFAVGLLAACSSSNSGTGSTGTTGAGASGTTGAGGTTTSSATTATTSTGGAGGAASTTAGTGGATCYPDDAGGSTDTWTNYAQAFFKSYCVECHGATIPNPENPSQPASQNFNLLTDVTPLKSTIRCGVTPGADPATNTPAIVQCGCNPNSFPPPGQFPIYDSTMSNMKPDSADRLRIVAWIDNGCPE
jgi:hypothetical protein